MDFSAIGSSLGTALGAEAPRILGAIVILIIGWIVAVFVRAGVRRLLAVARLNKRIAEITEQKLDLETGLSAGAFWLIILITLIGMFNSLDLTLASGPFEVLVKQIAAYLPRLVAGVLLVLVAWLAAVALRAIVNRVLDASGCGRKALGQRRHAADAQERRQYAFLAGDSPVRARDPQCLRPGRLARSGQGDGGQDPRHSAES